MGRFISAGNAIKHQSSRTRRSRKVICEALEDRQLMSLTIDVRGTDGSTSATVSTVGTVLHLELVAVITDANNTPNQDGLQDVVGKIISTAAEGHAVAGNLAAANIAPFLADGSAPGTQEDVNGDGNIDVGGLSTTDSVNDFFARSSPLQTSADGTIVGNTLTFEVGTLTYTVTNLNKGGTTDINFAPFVSSLPDAAAWLEDNSSVNNDDGVFQAGPAYTVSDSALIVPPVAVNDSVTATKNTALDINELADDDRIVALNPASVVVVTNAAHGTTALQSDGSILYTPTTGYVGADSFTYHVSDTDGRVSNTATVNINVVLAPAPIAGAVAATTLRNQAVTINVLADDSSVGTLTPGSVLVVTSPADGTAVVNSDGTILYTPHSQFTGTDTFTYTVSDSNDETSNPGTVTVTVNVPVPPVANNDSFTTSEGAPLSLNVLSNDTSASAALSPSTVDVDTGVQHGTTAVQSDGTILYTPAPGYIGTDSFTYTVADSLGDISNVAVVNLTVTVGVPPVASDVTAYALTGQANAINELTSVVSAATLVPTTAALVSQPTHGAVAIDATAGTFSYTPAAGFVGTDSFTYTVGNVNGDVSNVGTINLFVGTAVSNAKGSAVRSIAFTDAANGLETVSLTSGTADVYFSGTGTLATAKSGKATISAQSNLGIGNIALSGTSKSSSLSIKGNVKTPVTLGGITDSSPMGSVNAASANVSGNVDLPYVTSLVLGTVSNATFVLGSNTNTQTYNFGDGTLVSGSSPVAGHLALTTGAITNTSIDSEIPLSTVKIASWNNTAVNGLAAPTIGTLNVAGGFNAVLVVGVDQLSKAVGLGSAKIGGAFGGSLGGTLTASIGSVTVGSIATGWTGAVGDIKSFTVKSGGLSSAFIANNIGTLTVGGNVTGNITAVSATSIKVTGDISGSTMAFSGAAGLKKLTLTGALTDATVTSAGNIGPITAGSMSGSTITAGVASTVNFANATAGTLGSSTISSIRITDKTAGAFADTDILASKITAAALGPVETDNGGTNFGLATKSISSFSGTFANGPAHLGHSQLTTEVILQLYLTQQSIVFGDFEINIPA